MYTIDVYFLNTENVDTFMREFCNMKLNLDYHFIHLAYCR